MKKKDIVAALAVLACASTMGTCIVACGGDEETLPTYTVVFDSQGGSIISEQGVTKNDKALEPGAPTKYGYEFDGWYKDSNYTQVWRFETDKVTGDLTLYAKWKIKDATANTYFDFALDGETYAIKAKVGQTLPADVILPDTYDGKAITAIADGAFENQPAMRGVLIPDSIKTIGQRAFRNCANLEQIIEADNVESIGGTAFSGTKYETDLENGAAYIGKVLYKYVGTVAANTKLDVKAGTLGIAAGAMQDIKNITEVTLPQSLKNIGNYAFGGTENGSGITEIVIPDGVESIGANAFRNAKSLAKVTIGTNVKEIGANAFNGTAITTLVYNAKAAEIANNAFPDSTAAATLTFGDEVKSLPAEVVDKFTGMTAVALGSGITSLPDNAFKGKASLETLTINGKLTSIGASALDGTGIKEFTVGKEVTKLGNNAFKNCLALAKVVYNAADATAPASAANAFTGCAALKTIVIGDDVINIPDQLFAGVAVTSLTLGNKVESIGAEAFKGAAITALTIGESVKKIGADAFAETSALTAVTFNAIAAANMSDTALFPNVTTLTLGAKLTKVPAYMASGNTAIAKVTLPSTIAEIGAHAFDGCTSLAVIEGMDNVTSLGVDALKDTPWFNAFLEGDAQADGVVYLGKMLYTFNGEMAENYTLNVKEGTTSIAEGAFEGQTNLVAVNLPKSVTEIGASAFKGCSALAGTVDISNVTKVGAEAFNGDALIEAFTMDGKLEEVGASAFRDCSLADITLVMPETARSLGEYAFYNCENLKSIEIKGGITEIPTWCFALQFNKPNGKGVVTSVKLAPSVERVADYWAHLGNVKEFSAPGLKYVGSCAFRYLNLEYDTENLIEIGDAAFADWSGAKEIVIGENCTSYGSLCKLNKAENVKRVIIKSEHVTELPANMFTGVKQSVQYIKLPDVLTAIGDNACNECSQAVIEGGLTSALKTVGTKSFLGVKEFKGKVDLSGLTSIGNNAFNGSGLEGEVDLNAELESVGQYAFQNTKITKVTVNSDDITWGAGCFTGCANLLEVELSDGVKTFPKDAFKNVGSGKAKTLILPSTVTTIPSGSATAFNVIKFGAYVAPENLVYGAFGNGTYFVCKDAATLANFVADDSVWKTAAGDAWETTWKNRFVLETTNDGWAVSEGALVVYYGSKANIVIPQGLTTMPAISDILGTSAARLSSVTFTVAQGNVDFKVKDGALMNADETIVYGFSTASDIKSFSSATVTEVKPYAFAYAGKLTSISLPALKTVGKYAFAGTNIAAFTVDTNIPEGAFRDCAALINVTFGANCKEIGKNAFTDCAALKDVSLDSVTTIGVRAFDGCYALATVKIGMKCKSIGERAFINIDPAAKVTVQAFVPPSISYSFGDTAAAAKDMTFYVQSDVLDAYKTSWALYCPEDDPRIVADPNTIEGLVKKNGFVISAQGELIAYTGDKTNIVIPKELKLLDDMTVLLGKTLSDYPSCNVSVEEGSTAFKIDRGMLMSFDGKIVYFGASTTETTLTLTGVTEIKQYAFGANTHLTSIDMPNIVTIGDTAFRNAVNIVTIKIGANCVSIGANAFNGLTSESLVVTVNAVTPPELGTSGFGTKTKFKGKMRVPLGSVETYQAASGWSTYTAKIEAIPEETVTTGGGH